MHAGAIGTVAENRASRCTRLADPAAGDIGTVHDVIDLADAQRIVLEACPPLVPVDMAFTDAVGRVLAADVVATEAVPPFDNSAVDGYAVRAADVAGAAPDSPVALCVVGELAAGAAPSTAVEEGTAIRIMTGAAMPDGADAVVMVEVSERLGDDQVRLSGSAAAGQSVRRAGDDVRIGDVVFAAGTVVTPAVVGVLASINARTVSAHRPARVALLSTGDELVSDGRPLRVGEIRESNATMLAAALDATGCEVTQLGVVPDDEARLTDVLVRAVAAHDAVMTTGGVSMGDYDVVKAVLDQIADMHWMQIAIRPAKPFAFGMLLSTPIFGLPGNPVSSLVSFELLARPALRRMMGHRRLARPSVIAVCDEPMPRHIDGKLHFQRVIGQFDDDGRLHVRGVRAQGSHQLAATAPANGVAVVPDCGGLATGDEVTVLLFDM